MSKYQPSRGHKELIRVLRDPASSEKLKVATVRALGQLEFVALKLKLATESDRARERREKAKLDAKLAAGNFGL